MGQVCGLVQRNVELVQGLRYGLGQHSLGLEVNNFELVGLEERSLVVVVANSFVEGLVGCKQVLADCKQALVDCTQGLVDYKQVRADCKQLVEVMDNRILIHLNRREVQRKHSLRQREHR